MRRRTFSHMVLASAPAAVLPGLAVAQAAFKEGGDYLKLPRPAPVDAPKGKVEVVEVLIFLELLKMVKIHNQIEVVMEAPV